MRTSEQTGALNKAMAEARAEFPKIVKSGKGNYGKYAKLDDFAEVFPILAKHELSVTQGTARVDGEWVLTTRTGHSSGEWIEFDYPLSTDDARLSGAQAIGKGMTYARRYSLGAALQIVADEDDDGQAASDEARKAKPAPPRPAISAATAKAMADEQIKAIGKANSIAALNEAWKACANVRVELQEHAEAEYDRLVAAAQTKRDALNAALEDFPGDRPAPNGAALHP